MAVSLALLLTALALFFPAHRFADYPTYVVITDEMFMAISRPWYTIDPASSGILLLFRHLFGQAEDSVDAVHLLNLVAFGLLGLRIVRLYRATWQGALLALALYGPLLAFVTLRATPAYLLVALAAYEAVRGKFTSIFLCLIASLFHVSALLTLPPIAFTLFTNRRGPVSSEKIMTSLQTAGLVVAIAFVEILRTQLSVSVVDFISTYLPKYAVYVASLDPAGSDVGGLSEGHLSHTIYVILASAFVIFFLRQKDPRCAPLRGYVLMSYIIFITMEFSPVTAYRQSIYWMIPGVLAVSWNRYLKGGFATISVALVGAALFAFDFVSVLAP